MPNTLTQTCDSSRFRRVVKCVLPALVVLGTGCAPDLAGPPPNDPNTLFFGMMVNHHAVTLSTSSPYDTVRLQVTPVNPYGEPLIGLPEPTYSTLDAAVVVSPDGLVTAKTLTTAAGKPVFVQLRAANGITYIDTVFVRVTNTVVTPENRMATLRFVLAPGDSARTALVGNPQAPNTRTLAWSAVDSGGRVISSIPVYFRSSNPNVATINRTIGRLNGNLIRRPGRVTFYVSASVYGVALRDSLPYIIGYPLYGSIGIQPVTRQGDTVTRPEWNQEEIIIGVGGTVSFGNLFDRPLGIVFDDPSVARAVPGTIVGGTVGNIEPFLTDLTAPNAYFLFAARAFSVPGTHVFRTEPYGVVGRIIVRASPATD